MEGSGGGEGSSEKVGMCGGGGRGEVWRWRERGGVEVEGEGRCGGGGRGEMWRWRERGGVEVEGEGRCGGGGRGMEGREVWRERRRCGGEGAEGQDVWLDGDGWLLNIINIS